MRRGCAALVLLLLPLAASGQDPEAFTETAPPKVPLPLQDGAVAPDVPAETPPAAADPYMEEVGRYFEDDATAGDPAGADVPTASEGPVSEFSPVDALLRGIMGLGGALAIYLFGLYAVKRWGRKSPLLGGHQFGRVLGRVALSPHASLHFVRTNDEVLVVGVTQQSVNLLRTFDAADFDEASEREVESAVAPETTFLDQLKEAQGAMSLKPGVDEELDTLKGDLQRLKQYFQDSARARE